MKHPVFAALIALSLIPVRTPRAEDLQTFNLTLKAHRFAPAELHVPAGKPFFLVVSNEEDTPDEFETNSPPLEKVILPGSQGRVRVRPLAPGRFTFFDDFHPGTPRGVIVAE